MGAQVLVENTSFTGVERAIVTNLDSDEEGFANERNNLFTSSTTQITKKGTWTPSYKPMPLPLLAALLPSLLVLVSSPFRRSVDKHRI
jgi:hypothetical protein